MAKKVLVLVLALASLFMVAVRPAYCESQPRMTFYRYIRDLYYTQKLPVVANYWIKSTRLPLNELTGTRAESELKRFKLGYVAKANITVEVLDGEVCKMKGTGIAQDQGRTVPCTLDVVMVHEDGIWRIQFYTWRAEVMRTQSF